MGFKELLENLRPSLLFEQVDKEVLASFGLIGALVSLRYVMRPVCFLWRHYLRPRANFKKRYGDGWAVVTGASDGIGKSLAFDLASEGYRVALVARSAEKL